ncbi:MAG: FAD/FMN-dependent dehydrogenase [bacterium]|nr:MAG: FAD/FMN-dependent dehydrogenase [bacterium]
MENLLNALADWRDAIGTKYVLVDDPIVAAAQTATYITHQKVPAVIQPSNSDEVQQCVKIANKYKTPIYPISCGKNWGYGSRVPVQDGCVVMDLSRLNRILDYNEKLAYVTVEPGVTFSQLFLYLHEQKSNLFLSVTGTAISASLIGNVLERGIGKGPCGERIANVCGFEVILPTGECVHTGFGRFANAKATEVARCGVGPYLEGIFTQSNLGIVTKMTLWLTPFPKHFQTFFYSLKHESQLEPLIDILRDFKLSGLLRTPFLITNDYRRLSLATQYPWQESSGKTPLDPALKEKLKKAKRLGQLWAGEGALYCNSKQEGLAQRKLIKDALKGKVNNLSFIDENNLGAALIFEQSLQSIGKLDLVSKVAMAYHKSGFIGFPRNRALAMAYWRKNTALPLKPDLDKDKCGIIWISPTVPFDGQQIRTAINIMEEVFFKYQLEPNLGLYCATERSIDITGAIIYDREVSGEDEHAMKCYDDMLQKLVEQGYIPYRLGIHSMNSLPNAQDGYGKLLSVLKQAIDPNNILSPGRYDFRKDWPKEG